MGIVDLIEMEADIYKDDLGREYEGTDIPDEIRSEAEAWREKLVEAVSELDEDLMMKFLDGEEITNDEIRKAIRTATIAGQMIPVTCGSAYKNKGVQLMLDAVVAFMPSPKDIRLSRDRKRDRKKNIADDNGPFSALAFKIMADPFGNKHP